MGTNFSELPGIVNCFISIIVAVIVIEIVTAVIVIEIFVSVI